MPRLLTVTALLAASLGGATSADAAPGVPGPAQEVFVEGFENAPVASNDGPATLITAYQGAGVEAMTYTADNNWNGVQKADCNGLVVRGSMTNTVFQDCFGSVQQDGDLMRAGARALALVQNPALGNGSASALANHAVTAATAAPVGTTPSYQGVQLQTTKSVTTVPAGRFVNFSVDVAEVGCSLSAPNWARLRFARLDGSGNNPVDLTATPIVPCPGRPDGRGELITTITDTNPDYAVYGGRFPSSGSLLTDGSAFRVRMTNDPGGPVNGGDGNDSAIDNLRVIDATPVIDKRFVSPVPGALRTNLQIFVTNTDDLAAKDGFSFTDTLPAGLSIAPGAQPSVSCFAGGSKTGTTFPVSASGSQLTVAPTSGELGAGESHCRIDVAVVAAAVGTYTAGANLITSRVGTDQGTGDSVTFTPASTLPPSNVLKPQCSDGRDNDGDRAVDLRDPGCASAADKDEADESINDLVLCGRRKISLVRADARRRKVKLSGLVAAALGGKKVTLFARLGRRKVKLKTVKAKASGQFKASVKGPPRRLFRKARYYAVVAGSRSVALKLPQSLASSRISESGGTITVRGKVKRSLLGRKRNPVVVKRIVCGRYQTVGKARPRKSGAYTVRFKAPALGRAALYRAETRVLAKPRSKRYVRQFARAIGISLTGQTG